MTSWIKSTDKMPEEYCKVLVFIKNEYCVKEVWRDYRGNVGFLSTGCAYLYPDECIFWCNLPNPPEK